MGSSIISNAGRRPHAGPATDTDHVPRDVAGPAQGALHAGATRRPRDQARGPRALCLLGRLRIELGRIDPPPATPAEAHLAIVLAMTRALLGGWSLPALDAPANTLHADGSISVPLLTHLVVFNPWGAFRIVDHLRPATPYFEIGGRDGRAFRMPRA